MMKKKNYIFAHMSGHFALGGGLKALSDMSAKNVSFFGRLPLANGQIKKSFVSANNEFYFAA